MPTAAALKTRQTFTMRREVIELARAFGKNLGGVPIARVVEACVVFLLHDQGDSEWFVAAANERDAWLEKQLNGEGEEP